MVTLAVVGGYADEQIPGSIRVPGLTTDRPQIDAPSSDGDVPLVIFSCGRFVALGGPAVVLAHIGNKGYASTTVREVGTLVKPGGGMPEEALLTAAKAVKEGRVIHRR